MLKRPQWVKEKIDGKEKEVPLQMTVKKKYTLQSPYANMPTIGTTTGNGVDGMVQPGKMVDIQVHEGEGIIPNNAMQGLTESEFQGLVETLSSGNIDKNKLREAINMPTVQEYQAGGVVYKGDVPSSSEIPDYSTTNITNRRSLGVPGEGAKAVDPEPPPTKEEYLRMRFPNYGTDKNQTIQTSTVTRETPTAPTTRIRVPQQQTIATSTIPAESRTTAAEATTTEPPEPVVAPPETPPETIQTQEVQRETPETPIIKAPLQEMPTPPEEPPPEEPPPEETVTQPVVSPAGEMVRQGLQKILAEAQGVSEVDRKIANFYLQNTDASNAANLRILESQISADPNMSDQAKRAAIAGLQREAAANRSQLSGELAINAAERASTAARDIVTYGGQVRSYEEITLPAARQNLEIQRRTFDEITLPKSEIEIEKMKSELGAQNWDEIQEMIDHGVKIDRVNERLAEKGIRPLSLEEFTDILQAGSLGERNWGRQESAAQILLANGQYEAAATMFSNLYDGVNFDFSKLATQEIAENFSQGLSQMSSYVASGWNLDEALAAAREDGTLKLMGIDESQFAQFYNATNINALDAQWEEVESSQMYQNLLNSNDPADRELAANIKTVVQGMMMGWFDYDILHEYKITGPDGKEYGSVYKKTAEEAQEEANKLGVDYTVEDTGNISPSIKQPVTEELETGLASDWGKFRETIPEGVDVTEDLYQRWQSWRDAGNTGDYEEFSKTETPANRLQTIEVGTNKELLDKENSKILFDAFEQTPEELKKSDYYFQYPNNDYLENNITYKSAESVKMPGAKTGLAKAEMRMKEPLKTTFEEAVGKIVELPDGTIGQISEVHEYPNSIQLTVKRKDGTYEPYEVWNVDSIKKAVTNKVMSLITGK